MAIFATNSGGASHSPVPAGNYVARCYSMIHIGTSDEVIQGVAKRLNKVRITWELPTETKVFDEAKGEQPFVVSKEFTLSMNEKANLRKFLESWRGKAFTEAEAAKFDITKLLGVACMLNVIHKQSKTGNTYAEISSVSALPKGLQCPPQINPNFEFSYETFTIEKFNILPDFLKDKIKQTDEYKLVTMGVQDAHDDEMHNDIVEDNLPF
jgi:hypothetical protein